jgi:hypothetical protein
VCARVCRESMVRVQLRARVCGGGVGMRRLWYSGRMRGTICAHTTKQQSTRWQSESHACRCESMVSTCVHRRVRDAVRLSVARSVTCCARDRPRTSTNTAARILDACPSPSHAWSGGVSSRARTMSCGGGVAAAAWSHSSVRSACDAGSAMQTAVRMQRTKRRHTLHLRMHS